MQQVPLNCYIVIVLFLLTLNTTLPNECNPYNPLDFALSTMMKSRSVVIKEQVFTVTGAQKKTALKTHRKKCRIKCKFSITAISRPKSYYFSSKEMFAILAVSLFSDNVTSSIFCNRGVEIGHPGTPSRSTLQKMKLPRLLFHLFTLFSYCLCDSMEAEKLRLP